MEHDWDSKAWERATIIVAERLASFRLGLDADNPYAFDEHEKLCAGHIVGALSAAGLLKDRRNPGKG